jgi:hypothetical protein
MKRFSGFIPVCLLVRGNEVTTGDMPERHFTADFFIKKYYVKIVSGTFTFVYNGASLEE